MMREMRVIGGALLCVALAACATPPPEGGAVMVQASRAWHRDLPADPDAGVALWADLCTRRGGSFLAAGQTRLALEGASIVVPGGGWCRTVGPGNMLQLDGGWIAAEALREPANRTQAASVHSFLLTFASATTPRPPPEGEIHNAMSIMLRQAVDRYERSGFKVLEAVEPPDPAAPRCARHVIAAAPPGASLTEETGGRSRRIARLCMDPRDSRRTALLIVEEMRFAEDAGAEARGAPLRARMEALLDSIAFDLSTATAIPPSRLRR